MCCPNGCGIPESTCCGPNYYCIEGALCCLDPEDDTDYFCSPGPECIDTFTIDLADWPDGEEIFENMCRGIQQSESYSADKPNEIILEYIGPDESKRPNRIASGCEGSACAKLFSPTDANGERIAGLEWSCDEFPFASASQGGADASIICVPASINSGIGRKWGSQVKGKSAGYQARVKLKGYDCSKVSVDKRRSIDRYDSEIKSLVPRAGSILKNDSTGLYVDGSVYGNASDGKVALTIPFYIPYDFLGTFHLNYSIASGTLKSGSIIDDWGNGFGS